MKNITLAIILILFFSVLQGVLAQEDEDALYSSTTGLVKVGGYLQNKFYADESKDDNGGNQFRILRARLKVFGDINKYFSYNFMLGALEPPPAKIRTPQIVNAFIDAKFSPYANFRVGQFFVPFSYEGPHPITKNDMIERSDMTGYMNKFAIFRDIGVMFFGSVSKLDYKVSITNGTGANKNDDNSNKDIMSTIDYNILDSLMVGVSGHLGSLGTTSSSTTFNRNLFNRYQWNAHAKVVQGKWTVIGEFTYKEDAFNKANRSDGFYALVGYHINDSFEPVLRYSWIDQDLNESNRLHEQYTVGLNYFYGKHIRAVANYEIRKNDNNSNLGNLFTIMLQASY